MSSSSQNKRKIFVGRLVHSKSLKHLEILPHAALGVDEKGKITFLDSSVQDVNALSSKHEGFENAQIIQLGPLQFIVPGLIDTHLHAPQYPNLAIGMEGDLMEWVTNYTDPIEASYADSNKAKRVYDKLVQTTLALGTTTVAYNSTIHLEATNILADTCLKYGQRANIGKMACLVNSTHGNFEESTAQSLGDTEKSIQHILKLDPEGFLITPCVQPRGGRACPADLMTGLGELGKRYGESASTASTVPLRVQAHMSEAKGDMKLAFELHPGYENYTELYQAYNLLHSRSILAHCIHLSPRDVDLLVETKAGIAHNPNSNTCLRDGECRVRELLDRGVKVGLGTDCSAGYSISIMDAMRQASNVSRHLAIHKEDNKWTLAFEEILYLATIGGAQVMGLDDKIGNFEVGKCFDALIVDVSQGMINIEGWENDGLALAKKWVFMGDDRSIRKVYVNGHLVVDKDKK